MQTLSQKLRTEAALIANNGITRKLPRSRIARLMLDAADALAGLESDKARLDWLADRNNRIGNVQLPRECVLDNVESLRGAIDDAMKLSMRPNS